MSNRWAISSTQTPSGVTVAYQLPPGASEDDVIPREKAQRFFETLHRWFELQGVRL